MPDLCLDARAGIAGAKIGENPAPSCGRGVLATIALGPAEGNVIRPLSDVYAPPDTLALEVVGADVRYDFEQRAQGDSNMDGITNGMDVFPLAFHFGHESNWNGHTATDEQDDCIDLNRDGVLNGLDLFIISVNFNKGVTEYRLEYASQADEIYSTAETIPFVSGDCIYLYEGAHQPGGGDWFYRVLTYHQPTDSLSVPSDYVSATVNPVAITNPQSGEYIEGNVEITVSVPVSVDRVEYTIGGTGDGSETSAPFSHNFDTTLYAEGPLTIEIAAFDGVDEVGQASVTPIVDNQPPFVEWTSPNDLDTISGYTMLTANAGPVPENRSP